MRARPATVLGAMLVFAFAAAAVVVVVTTPHRERAEQGPPEAAARAFVGAWERSREGTYLTRGTFERRSDVTGAAITSEDVVVQRPPRRVHRQMGGTEGRVDAEILVCPAPGPGQDQPEEPCRTTPGGGTYEESVAREVAGVESVVVGADRLYDVSRDGLCFELDLIRPDPRAPFGIGARFCFDERTGAPLITEVRYEGGIRERVVVEEVSAVVTDEDLEP